MGAQERVRSIHIEGMDLAGKTTLVRSLAEHRPDAELRHNALTQENEIYVLADAMRLDGKGSGAVLGPLYLAALTYDLEAYRAPTGTTIQDSTVALRSLAYYGARGDGRLAADFEGLLGIHPCFDRSIVLTAAREARLERLEARRRANPAEVADDDLLVVGDPELFYRMEARLIEAAVEHFGAIVVDTSELSPAEVLARVEEAVSEG